VWRSVAVLDVSVVDVEDPGVPYSINPRDEVHGADSECFFQQCSPSQYLRYS
jgi:hypothetical protein